MSLRQVSVLKSRKVFMGLKYTFCNNIKYGLTTNDQDAIFQRQRAVAYLEKSRTQSRLVTMQGVKLDVLKIHCRSCDPLISMQIAQRTGRRYLLRRSTRDCQNLTVDPSTVLTCKEGNHPRNIFGHRTTTKRAMVRHQGLNLLRRPVR